METIIATIIVALILSFLLGILLGLFKKIFAVKTDPKVGQIREALSGANCGGCGFAGCDSFAEAVASGKAEPTGCIAGGSNTAKKIAELLGVSAQEVMPKVTFLACNGTKECAKERGTYNGVKTCKAAALSINGTKVCAFGCIGLGDCIEVCPFDALHMGKDGLPVVDYAKCTGCGKCAAQCPKKLFHIIPKDTKGSIAMCSNRSDNKPQIRKDCSVGCFKCGMCVRKCPEHCIELVNGIPQIDYTKCTSCKECINACPDKVLHLFQDLTLDNSNK